VILEAMGMGAAVISANCPSGPSELINDGINGLLVKTDDVSDLARAMKCLMSQPDVRNQIGKEAVKVREIYRQEKIMMQWEKILLCQD
jgi:glycosyltransferase involved in cell wall biosynthesis